MIYMLETEEYIQIDPSKMNQKTINKQKDKNNIAVKKLSQLISPKLKLKVLKHSGYK